MRHATLVVLSLLLASTAWAQSRTFTLDADFDEGTLVNVNHNAPNNNQLQLNTSSGTFPFIWVALSQRCTIAKVDTRTGAILGEYRTIADNVGCSESSRTTVAIDGSVWVGHRGSGGVTHVGLAELNQCFDRNGNGTIETSTGYGDVMPWPGVAPSNVATAADECILHHADTDALSFGDTRHMSIDASNNLWVGSYVSRRFVRVNGATGAIDAASLKTGFSCGGYGGLIDNAGVIWSANGGGTGLLRWDPSAPDVAGVNPRCINVPVYGLAIDPAGWLWVNEFGANVRKVSPDGTTILGPFSNGSSTGSQGLAVDGNGDVWISSSLNCGGAGCTIGHLKNDGTFVGNVPNPTGAGSTGISVDADGKIWSANRSANTATRIDPTLGPLGADGVTPVGQVDLTVNFPSTPGRPLPFPYNYSDMTGAQLFNSTAPQGSWTVTLDGTDPGKMWSLISWNASTLGGSSLVVEARAADTQAGLGAETYMAVSNGGSPGVMGRFIQVRTTLLAASDGTSPVLFDLTVSAQPQNGCTDPATMPSYAGGYVLNAAGTRAFIVANAPQGLTKARFYNTTNLNIGDPETDKESGTPLPGVSRVGDTFMFAGGSEPMMAYFPVTPGAAGTHVAFFLELMDTCQRTVDVDPDFTITGLSPDEAVVLTLEANQPNPFAGETAIRFSLPEAGHVTLMVYDVLGREVARLADGQVEAGWHTALLDAASLPTGLYVYRLTTTGRTLSRTMTLAR